MSTVMESSRLASSPLSHHHQPLIKSRQLQARFTNTPTPRLISPADWTTLKVNTGLILVSLAVSILYRPYKEGIIKWTGGMEGPVLKALVILGIVNILWTLLVIWLRLVKRIFNGTSPAQQPLDASNSPLSKAAVSPSPQQLQQVSPKSPRTIYRDASPASTVRPSPLRFSNTAAGDSSAVKQQMDSNIASPAAASLVAQTPTRSPYSRIGLGSATPSILGTPALQSASVGTAAGTPQQPTVPSSSGKPTPLFTPSPKSINLRSPSVLTPSSARTTAPSMLASTQPTPSKIPIAVNNMPTGSTPPQSTGKSAAEDMTKASPTPQLVSSPAPPAPSPITTILHGEAALKDLGLQGDFEDRVEGMRAWFCRMIVRPLVEDIERVEQAFQAQGLPHLGPLYPASMTLIGRQALNAPQHDLREAFFVTPATLVAATRPQTLMELAQTHRGDPIVQTRLRIEKYLDLAVSGGGYRTELIKRLKEMAADPFLALPHLSTRSDDALILMHLFCTFMDERLPSSDLYAAQPFTTRHYQSACGDAGDAPRPAIRVTAPVTLVQAARNPPAYHILTVQKRKEHDDPLTGCSQQPQHRIYKPLAAPGTPLTVLQTLVLFVEYTKRRLDGHLGIANLASRAIGL